jgi:hypothetical protein
LYTKLELTSQLAQAIKHNQTGALLEENTGSALKPIVFPVASGHKTQEHRFSTLPASTDVQRPKSVE